MTDPALPILAPKVTGEPDVRGEIRVHLVELRLCELCLLGRGGECHVPGCALWLNRAPDLALHPEMYAIIDQEGVCRFCGCTDERACDGGCTWVDPENTVCSQCVTELQP